MSSVFNNVLLAASGNAAQNIASAVQAYVGPFLLLIIGIVAITFLFKRQVTQFVIFLVIALGVAIFFYAPGVIVSIAKSFTGETGVSTGDTGW